LRILPIAASESNSTLQLALYDFWKLKKGKRYYIQRSQSDNCCHPVMRLIEIPCSPSPSINVGKIGEKWHKGYQGIRFHSQDIREDITLAKETDNGCQPDFGLVVNSHKYASSFSHINKPFMIL
jgi:hypothetical protein